MALPHVLSNGTAADAGEVNGNCPAGQVMVSVHLPELAYSHTNNGCGTGTTGLDDFRIECCELVLVIP